MWWGVEMKSGVTEGERRETKLFSWETEEMASRLAQMAEKEVTGDTKTQLACVVFMLSTDKQTAQSGLGGGIAQF